MTLAEARTPFSTSIIHDNHHMMIEIFV